MGNTQENTGWLHLQSICYQNFKYFKRKYIIFNKLEVEKILTKVEENKSTVVDNRTEINSDLNEFMKSAIKEAEKGLKAGGISISSF